MPNLAGKHIVITGASAGIGAELARQLGARGAHVVVAARRADRLDAAAAAVHQAGGQAIAVKCDVTDRNQVFALAAQARAQFGEIDVWVNNAGAGMRHRLLDATDADMVQMYRLNCLGALWGWQAVIPRWLEAKRAGQIIDVNSVGGQAGFAFNGAYCAAKHALDGMGDSLRQELAGSCIMLTSVYPGLTTSEFSENVVDRTGADPALRTEALSRRGNALVRKVSHRQTAAEVAASIVRAIERPRTHVYPHRWAAFAGLVYRLAPGFVLGMMSRSRRER